jgi:hypothetical protein
MAAVFLTVPAYSSVKATYSLAVLPCYGLVIARGFEALLANHMAWTVAAGFLASWAGVSFFGYLT